MVELQSPAALDSYLAAGASRSASALRSATTAARNQIAIVEGEQRAVVKRLEDLQDVNVLYRVQRVLNGIAVDVDVSQLDAIAKLPGVKSVQPIELVTISNTSSVPLVGAVDVWKSVHGATGKNLRIGVIDTGIDYLHRDFGGDGDYTGRTLAEPAVTFHAKVAGGTDLAGDEYDASSPDAKKRTPVPDPDPMDCWGHGSHVAGTLAGYGVLKDGATYTGSYDAIDESKFSIGPGVAPEAQLYAIRIFGCAGPSSLTTAGLEWALDPNQDGDFSDRMDIVNLSLGSTFGTLTSPTTAAAEKVARAGTIVVAAALNAGDTYYIVSSPGIASGAISVASSVDEREPGDALLINGPTTIAGTHFARHAVNYDWSKLTNPVTGTVAYPLAQRSGCVAFTPANAAAIQGKIALLDWTDNECGSGQRVNNAQAAGAIGVIVRYTKSSLDNYIAGSTTIPSTLVSLDTGNLIIANLSSGVSATLSAELRDWEGIISPATDTLSGFTSRGPRGGDSAIKPEITAPGQSIYSVLSRGGSRGVSMSGTSMATPIVAGSFALLKQIHPTWTAEELKALVMNTASHDLFTEPAHGGWRYGISRIGAGRLDVLSASRATAVAFNADDPGMVGVSFGVTDVSAATTREKNIVVENKSADPATFVVSYDAVVDQPGVSFSFPNGNSLTVPPNGSAAFVVRLTIDASAIRHRREGALTARQNEVTRHWMAEASGYVILSTPQETLRVPLLAIVRATAAMHAVEKSIPAAETMTLHLAGNTIATGSALEDENAIVSAFELADRAPTSNADLTASPHLQLTYAGIATDAAAVKAAGKPLSGATIYFAIVTKGPWSTPAQTPVRIDIDTNNDGTDDKRVSLGDLATFSTASAWPSDVFIATACSADGTSCTRQFVNNIDASTADTVLFNTNVMVLPVRAADLGLSDAASTFSYRIRVSSLSQTVRHTYDIATPGLSFSSSSPAPFGFFDAPGNTITVKYDAAAFAKGASAGILLLHHHNATGSREEVVAIVKGKRRAVAQ